MRGVIKGHERTRETYAEWLVRMQEEAADGQRVGVDEPFTVGGEKLMFPGDGSLGATGKNLYNCRCTLKAMIKGHERTRETYSEWLERKQKVASNDKISYNESAGFYGDPIRRGVGAKSITYPDVLNPETGENFDFVPGTRPYYPSDHIMAGKGCKTGREIDDIDRLVETYKLFEADAAGWSKEKARYEAYDQYGEIRTVEIHWYRHDNVGRVEEKAKNRQIRPCICR